MIEETGYIRVLFTVTCGDLDNGGCPPEAQLALLRILSERPADPALIPSWEQDRKMLVDDLRARHLVDNNLSLNKQSLIDIGHYRMVIVKETGENVFGRDVFIGVAQAPPRLFARNAETDLLELMPEAQVYFATMFSAIFSDLEIPELGDGGFCWLTWVVVPLIEALDGRFNPLGMGGIGHC